MHAQHARALWQARLAPRPPPLSMRRRATDSMARAEQVKGVVQLSSLQTGGAGTRSMVWPFHVESWADRLHDSDQRAGKKASLLGALFATAW